MEQLPQTKGKGVLMFAKRRQRMDEISAEHEEMRLVDSVAGPESETVNTLMQRGSKASQDIYIRQYQEQPFQQSASGTNGLDPHQDWAVPRQLVSNRTAKPFLGGDNQGQNTFSPVKGVLSPTPKKHDNIFKVPVPVNTAPHVWSPTSDIIASRDERIAIPAIKTGILPETKRRGAIKTELKETSLHQKKGRSFTDSVVEEDFLSLGAEACNFMQAPSVKLKKPPPVLPKPVLNTAHPPWSTEGHITSKSPVMTSSSVHGLGINLMDPLAGSIVKKQSSAFWTTEAHQVKQTPDSTRAGSSQSATPLVRPPSAANSVASCPPQHLCKSLRTKAPIASQQDCSTETRSSEGLHLKGKGAELFARRQTRMEKYVVDDETVRANKVRPSSPTLSMPSTWKYSSNVRAPPPVSYNPILSPFYPLAAIKQQPPSTSPKLKAKVNKEKKNPPPKHLNVLDVMKHQPYQLDSTLFTYSSTTDVKEEVHLKELETSAQGPNNLPSQSYQTTPNPNVPSKILHSKQSSSKDTAELRVPYPFVRQTKSNEDAGVQHLTGGHHLSFHGGSGNYMSSRNTGPAVDLHVNNQYVPRSVLSVAPKPKFSAKKSNMRGKQWKPVIAQH